jgi:hypothetical protein
MAAVTPTNKTRAATATHVMALNAITSNMKEIADLARGVGMAYQEVERDKADMLADYTRRMQSPECHCRQSRITVDPVLGPLQAREKKIGEVRSADEPTKPGKRNMLDGRRTYKAARQVAEVAASGLHSSTLITNREERTASLPSEKNFAR